MGTELLNVIYNELRSKHVCTSQAKLNKKSRRGCCSPDVIKERHAKGMMSIEAETTETAKLLGKNL
jgi:hypothetical protein